MIVHVGDALGTSDGLAWLRSPFYFGVSAGTGLAAAGFACPLATGQAAGTPPAVSAEAPHTSVVQNALRRIKDRTGLTQERLAELLRVTRQALYQWEQGGQLSDARRRHVLAVAAVVEHAAARYPTPDQLAAWLDTPRGVEGRTPAQELASGNYDRTRYLAVSSPSSGLQPSLGFARRPVAPAARKGVERFPRAVPPDRDDEAATLLTEENDDGSDGSDTDAGT